MKKKTTDSLIAFLFIAVLALGLSLFCFLPKADFSREERRVLAAPPSFSLNNLLDGTFTKDTTSYLTDHFPLRKSLVGLYSYVQSYGGRDGESGVYRGKNGYLFPVPATTERWEKNLAAVANFGEKTGVNLDLMLIPESGSVLEDLLPLNHLSYKDEELSKDIDLPGINNIDVLTPLSQSKNKRIYFKTDHHWTSQGAYIGYLAYCAAKKITPLDESAFTKTEYQNFYGTSYAKSGLWGIAPDILETWTPPTPVTVCISDNNKTEDTTTDTMFFPTAFYGQDPYNIFFNGNHSIVTITNPQAEGGKLLVIKDSYANALVPFLSQHFHEIQMVDLRHFRKENLSTYVKDQGFTDILILYGISQFAEDSNIIWLK